MSHRWHRLHRWFRLTAKNRSHRNHGKHGKHRKFYSLALINGGLRPWAASQLVCLAEIAESAERFSPDGENLGHTDYTDYTDWFFAGVKNCFGGVTILVFAIL